MGAEFETGTVTIALIVTETLGIEFSPHHVPIALHVDDVAASRAELESRGVIVPGRDDRQRRVPPGAVQGSRRERARPASPVRAAGVSLDDGPKPVAARRRPPLILLPPSEGKWAPARGKPIDLASLSFPGLTQLRDGLLDDELRQAPTTTAARLYTGVLYAALDIATLPRGAARNIVIISAQFGALRPGDRVPAYKRELDAAYWRAASRRHSTRRQRDG